MYEQQHITSGAVGVFVLRAAPAVFPRPSSPTSLVPCVVPRPSSPASLVLRPLSPTRFSYGIVFWRHENAVLALRRLQVELEPLDLGGVLLDQRPLHEPLVDLRDPKN